MGQHHVLLAAVHEAAQATVGTQEPAQAAVPPLASPPHVAVPVGDVDDIAETEWQALVLALAPLPRTQPRQRTPEWRAQAKARKQVQRAVATGATGFAGAATAAATAEIAAQCRLGLSEREAKVWLPSALRGDPLGFGGRWANGWTSPVVCQAQKGYKVLVGTHPPALRQLQTRQLQNWQP